MKYLIVGGGMTGDAAVKGIRQHDADGEVTLVGEEAQAPYARPPLSKGLWKGKDEASIGRGTEEHGVDLKLGRKIVSLDLDAKQATDDAGETYDYDRLLLATGGAPRQFPGAPEGVIYFRTLDDYRRLRDAAADGRHAVVIGGGFIGSELAAALASTGAKVTMLFPEPAIGSRLFPAPLAEFLNDYYREQGVEVLPGETVESVSQNGAFTVTTASGKTIEGDVVVAGLGIEPRTELALDAGIPVDNGIPVDDHGRVGGRDDVFAAGDVARFPASVLGTERPRRARGPREEPRRARSARTWPAPTSRTTTCRSSTPTCSTSATRRSARSTRASRPSRPGPSRTARASSPTSTTRAGRAASCSGTSGARSTPRRS